MNITEGTYTHVDGTACCTPRLRGIALLPGHKPVEHVAILNAVGNCNTTVFVYLNISNHRKGTVKILYKR